jgi:murein L,D-transpeptidase YafK
MVKRQVYGFVVLVFLPVLLASCASSAQTLAKIQTKAGAPNYAPANNAANTRPPLELPLINPRVEVRKAERKLLLFSNGNLVRTYQVGLGLSPVGDKIRSGDHRTPEGDFYIFIKNPKSAFYLSLGVSYPNLTHARRGLRDGLISQAQYDQIAAAIKQKKTPLQRTRLGGDIFIHGHGASSDWTWGCVALENEDIRELYEAIEVGTPVTIKP